MLDLLKKLIEFIRDPGPFIVYLGYPGLALVVFLETGALIALLPGDSLLVTAGLYAAKGDLSFWLLNLILIPMAVLGDATSYTIGSRLGPALFTRPESWLFKPKYIQAAKEFYEKHGGKAIIIARFMPVVRTFVPVVAGAVKMPYRRFATFNVIGAVLWINSMLFTGYFLVKLVPGLEKRIDLVVAIVIFLSLTPAMYAWVRAQMARLRARG